MRFFAKKCDFLQKNESKTSRNEFEKLGHYRNISEIQKMAISKTREIKNFGKNRLSQGLNQIHILYVPGIVTHVSARIRIRRHRYEGHSLWHTV